MISGQTLALAHGALCLVFLGAAAVSAYRARNGVRVGRRGARYHRFTTRQMLARLDLARRRRRRP